MLHTKRLLFFGSSLASLMGLVSQPTPASAFSMLSQLSFLHRLTKTPYYDDGNAASTTTTVYSSYHHAAAAGGGDGGSNNCSSSEEVSLFAESSVTADDLRKITVTNSKGQSISLGDLMGSDKWQKTTTILVFLRHLGCFHCWSYAREWSLLMSDEIRLAREGQTNPTVVGPIFVSIGDENRLQAFLDKHPDISPSQIAVDGYDFAAYKKAGFGRFDKKPESVTQDVIPKPIKLGGWRGWWTFLSSFMPLAPVTPDMKFPEMLTPEGLLWVGGTIVIQGDEIVYRWDDRISGDYPDASKVLAIARDAAESLRTS
jgi:hypothetical protein